MNWLSKIDKNLKIRVIYWGTVLLAMVFIILPMFFFFYLFNEDQVKQMIVDQFNNENYHVEVVGHVVPQLWHGLSIEVSDVAVSNKDDVPLFRVNKIDCQMSWLSLVFGKYSVRRMEVTGVAVEEEAVINNGLSNLLNFSHLEHSKFNHLDAIDISGIHTVGDNQEYHINRGSLNLKQNGMTTDLSLGFKLIDQDLYVSILGSFSLDDNIVKFNSFNTTLYSQNLKAEMSSDASYDLADKKLLLKNSNGRISIADYSGNIDLNQLTLSLNGAYTNTAKLDLRSNSNELLPQKVLVSFNQLAIPEFKKFAANNMEVDYSTGIGKSKLSLTANLTKMNLTNDFQINGDSCSSKVDFILPNLSESVLHANLDGICEYIPKRKLIHFDFKGAFDKSPLNIALQIFLGHKKPYIVASGKIKSLDFSHLQLTSQDQLLPLYYDNSSLPFSWLSLFDLNATLGVGQVLFQRGALNDLVTQFTVANNQLKISKIRANIYSGTLSGSAKITKLNNDQYNITTMGTLYNLELQSMFDDIFNVRAIRGKANVRINISANKVNSYNDIHKKITGTVAIDANQGMFQGIDFDLFVNPNKIGLNTKPTTAFQKLRASFNFMNGISKNGSLSFSSPYVFASGFGIVDFINEKLDYNLQIKSSLPRNDQKISSVLIPVKISGPLFSPKINIQNIHLISGGHRI